jgi:anti-anti-sigma factor
MEIGFEGQILVFRFFGKGGSIKMNKLELIEKDDISIIRPHGEMTFFFLEELDEFIKDKVKDNYFKFIYDMEDVSWIDSMGLGLLAVSVKVALINNSRICIVKPRDNIIELLRLSSLIDLVVFQKTVDNAVDFFKN